VVIIIVEEIGRVVRMGLAWDAVRFIADRAAVTKRVAALLR
jgi:hypothetical protein